MAKYLQDIRQGDSRTIRIDYGNGFDISGWTFYFTMSLEIDQVTPDVEISTNVGDHPEDDAANGIVNIYVPDSVTAALSPDAYYYSIKRTDNDVTPDIKTILPPIDDYKDRLRVIQALKTL